MPARHGLFRLHHEQARRASRRLSMVFWLGVCASGAIYFLLGLVFCEALRLLLRPDAAAAWQLHPHSLWIGGLLASLCMLMVVGEYIAALSALQSQTAAAMAERLYAKPIAGLAQPQFVQLGNIVEEMALAGGMLPPPVFYLPNDDSINAFVLGGRGQSLALVVSNGLLAYLDRDEQQAVIAHEFGHIKNEDVFIYAKLSAVLKGYYAISEWRHGGALVSLARENIFSGLLRREDGRASLWDILRATVGTTGLILAMIGERIQTAFSREREWMADARAVQYTRNPQALIMAFKKALALQYLRSRPFAMPGNQAHHLFINYFDRMHTHPPLRARIARYGGHVDDQEIEALAYEIRSKRLHSATDNPVEINRQAFSDNAVFPILTVLAAQRLALPGAIARLPLRKQLLAFFIYHSGMDSLALAQSRQIPEEEKAVLSRAFAAVKTLPPMQHFASFQEIAAAYCAQSSAKERQALWQQVKAIMREDGHLNFYEICYAAQLHFLLQAPDQERGYREAADDIRCVLRLTASLHNREQQPWQPQRSDPQVLAEEQAQCYGQLLKQTFPLHIDAFAPLDCNAPEALQALFAALRGVSQLRPGYRRILWQSLDAHWRRQGMLNLQEVHLRQLLAVLLG